MDKNLVPSAGRIAGAECHQQRTLKRSSSLSESIMKPKKKSDQERVSGAHILAKIFVVQSRHLQSSQCAQNQLEKWNRTKFGQTVRRRSEKIGCELWPESNIGSNQERAIASVLRFRCQGLGVQVSVCRFSVLCFGIQFEQVDFEQIEEKRPAASHAKNDTKRAKQSGDSKNTQHNVK